MTFREGLTSSSNRASRGGGGGRGGMIAGGGIGGLLIVLVALFFGIDPGLLGGLTGGGSTSVSYTHLTLPTNREV